MLFVTMKLETEFQCKSTDDAMYTNTNPHTSLKP